MYVCVCACVRARVCMYVCMYVCMLVKDVGMEPDEVGYICAVKMFYTIVKRQ